MPHERKVNQKNFHAFPYYHALLLPNNGSPQEIQPGSELISDIRAEDQGQMNPSIVILSEM